MHMERQIVIRISPGLKSSVLISRVQGSKMSRSTSSILLWSFVYQEALEMAWILLNFRKPTSWTCTCGARICNLFFKPDDDSSSMMHDEHDYARILRNWMKKIENWRERNLRGKCNFWSKILLFPWIVISIWLLYHPLIMLKMRLSFG